MIHFHSVKNERVKPSFANLLIIFLVGFTPFELVQLALHSPHRALAASCFGFGLPNSLFRQLRPVHSSHSFSNASQPTVREWKVFVPIISSNRWMNLLVKLTVDAVIVALAGIVMWRNWLITGSTMIPWRCEYTMMLFLW